MQDNINSKITEIAKKLQIPLEYLPEINIYNDYAKPYIEIYNNIIYYIIRERGVEYERTIYHNIDDLLYRIFEDISFELG